MEAFIKMDTNIDKLNVEQSRQQKAKKWGTWEKKDNEIIIVWKDGSKDTWEDETSFSSSCLLCWVSLRLDLQTPWLSL